MKILQIANRVPFPPKDGGAIGLFNFVKNYHKAGADLTLFALNTNKHYIRQQDLPEEFMKYADIHLADIDTSVRLLPALLNLFTTKSYNIERFRSKQVEKDLIRILKTREFDVVHFDGPFVAMYLDAVKKYSKAKTVMRAHNVEYLIWERLAGAANQGLKKYYLRLLAKRLKKYELEISNRFDLVLPISEVDKEFFRSQGVQSPMYVLPAGVDLDVFVPENSITTSNSVFHLGSLDWMPNVEAVKWFVEKVWPLVIKKMPDARFIVAGRNMPDHMKTWNFPGVNFLGEVDNAVDFMNRHEIMVVPLLSGSGMRLKILEGMALKKTIVSTSIGAEGISVTEGENIFIADDPVSFANKVLYCLENPETAKETGQKAHDLVKARYTNIQLVKGLLQFYSAELLKGNNKT